jgi:hypothetical protein
MSGDFAKALIPWMASCTQSIITETATEVKGIRKEFDEDVNSEGAKQANSASRGARADDHSSVTRDAGKSNGWGWDFQFRRSCACALHRRSLWSEW